MSAWLQTFLLGALFGLTVGFCLAVLVVKVEARREARYRRPGYVSYITTSSSHADMIGNYTNRPTTPNTGTGPLGPGKRRRM